MILETPYRPSYVDSNSPEAVTIGGGAAWVLSGGTLRAGTLAAQLPRGGHRACSPRTAASSSSLPGRTWVELADPVDGPPAIS